MKLEQIALGYATFQKPEWKTISNEAKIFIKNLVLINTIPRNAARQALDDHWIKIFTGVDTIEVTQTIT